MLPTLLLIITAYAVVRLVTVGLRQFPTVEQYKWTRAFVAVLAVVAIVFILVCTSYTLQNLPP